MQKLLEEIRAVLGVTGVLVWDKKRLVSFPLLPSSFAEGIVRSICSKMVKLAGELKSNSQIKLVYENGTALVLNRPNAAVLVLGRANLNFPLLDLVLSSSLSRLDRFLLPGAERVVPPPLEQKKVDFLVGGMNLLSRFVCDKIGPYRTTQNLRKVKDRLATSYPFMANLFVDNNASISIIKGKQGIWSGEVVLAFAKWAAGLEKLSFKKQGEIDLKKITSPLEENLEGLGFYFLFQNMKGNI